MGQEPSQPPTQQPSPWARASRKPQVDNLLKAIRGLKESLEYLATAYPKTIEIVLDEKTYHAVVIELLSEMQVIDRMDMRLHSASAARKFSLYGITIRAEQNETRTSGWSNPSQPVGGKG